MQLKNLDKHLRYFKAPGLSLVDKYKLHKRSRYKPFNLDFFGKKIRVQDSGSFLGVYQEMFVNEIYKFKAASNTPVIIDCGSNIGLSVIYFKELYPQSRIIAFEADPDICKVLSHNVRTFGFKDVEIHSKAVWIHNGSIEFQVEGGASGMINTDEDNESDTIKIPAVRLKTILQKYDVIDLLKIDIEGAEFEVINDCAEELSRAQHLFIEYHSMEQKEQQLGYLLSLLTHSGFRYHITEAYTSTHPFVKVDTMMGMDLLLNIYAYRF